MSTSTGKFSKPAAKTALAYTAITSFTAFFGGVYEIFSHGVISYYMVYAFGIPLLCGVMPNIIAAVIGAQKPHKVAYNLYNSGVATITVGCIFEGVLEIYGTVNDLVYVYLFMGVALFLAGIFVHFTLKIFNRKSRAKH